jgi:thiamine transport system ATP-binding protein
MLQLDNLILELGDFRLSANITLATGGRTAIMGPSGGGKSTLLSAIAGFLTPQSGRILWDGRDITALPPGQRPVSILFQDNNLFPHLTIAQNVGLALAPRLSLGPAGRSRVDAALTQVGLAGLGPRRPAALSGGQQSRAALARTLLSDRPLVLMDEPFAALGPALRAEMLDLAATILGASGRTLVLVTHDPDDALQLGGDICLVADGFVTRPAPSAALLANPPPALRDYLGSPPRGGGVDGGL